MARYIDVESLDVATYKYDNEDFIDGVTFVLEKLDAIPTADVVEVKHGEWKHKRATIDGEHYFCCSECGREVSVNIYDNPSVTKFYPYCHCGARMGECKRCFINPFGNESNVGVCNKRGVIGAVVQLDDFCSYGTPKERGGEK